MVTLEFEVWGRVSRPLGRVFRAVQNPRELSAYFTTGGASAALEAGKTVTWDFADFPGEFPVQAKSVVGNKSILISWSSATGGNNDVLFKFKKISPRSTEVRIRESGPGMSNHHRWTRAEYYRPLDHASWSGKVSSPCNAGVFRGSWRPVRRTACEARILRTDPPPG